MNVGVGFKGSTTEQLSRGCPLRGVDIFGKPFIPVSHGPFSFFDLFNSLSTALDLMDPRMGDHHKLTCYIAASLAKSLNLTSEDYRKVFASALVHDLGATSLKERLDILDFDVENPGDHALMGEAILSVVEPLSDLATHVGDHHVIWNHGKGEVHRGREVSIISHILQLADRVAVLIDRESPLVLLQAGAIKDKISDRSGDLFPPELTTAFCDIAGDANFWLGMDPGFLEKSLRDLSSFQDVFLDLGELESVSGIFAFIIDSRSRFTASHSSGVATVAEALALAHGLGQETGTKLRIAGYLHDIGKLSVPSEILEKRDKLSEQERVIMNGHSFYTHKITKDIRGLEQISGWAANHHEFINGSGYPFGLEGSELSIESRVMTVADIFTALAEDRPYRPGVSKSKALEILNDFLSQGKIDRSVMQTLTENVDDINEQRRNAQAVVSKKMDIFWKAAAIYMEQREKQGR